MADEPEVINTVDILVRYIAHVISSEGTDFLSDHYRRASNVQFTDAEWEYLTRRSEDGEPLI